MKSPALVARVHKLLQLGFRLYYDRGARPVRGTRLLVEALEDRTLPSVLIVTNPNDTHVAGDGSLRGEILAAKNGDTIEFSAALQGKTISLTSHNEILVGTNITIKGPGAGKLTVSGSGSRLFEIASGAAVTISGLTLQNGNGSGNGSTGEGGAILNHGNLTLSSDVIEKNSATGSPGGAGRGGAVFSDTGSSLVLNGDTLKQNKAQGGKLNNAGIGSTSAGGATSVAGSSAGAGQGGGVFATGASLTVQLSTFSGNRASGTAGAPGKRMLGTSPQQNGVGGFGGNAKGGGLYVDGGTVQISQSTIAANVAAGGKAGNGGNAATVTVGGFGGNGGNAKGGGLYVSVSAATITVTADTFVLNSTKGGNGGGGGIGGRNPTGSNDGGDAGAGGDALGGAVLVDGGDTSPTVNLTNDTLAANSANAGNGGNGGNSYTLRARHGTGYRYFGTGGRGGDGGNAQGGGLWAAAGTIILVNDTIAGSSSSLTSAPTASNSANAGKGGSAGTGILGNPSPGSAGTGQGGGVFNAGAAFTLKNTIVANNAASESDPDVSGSFTAQDHNLIEDPGDSSGFGNGDLSGVDPQLSVLGNYGGPTQTLLPLGGPAIDAGDDAGAPATDQRGITRPQGSHVDIGAVEVGGLSFVIVSGNPQSARRGRAFRPLVVKVTENGKPVAGVAVAFAVVLGNTGAGAKPSHKQVTTAAKGTASVGLTANAKAGTFTVTAQIGGAFTLTFDLTDI